jgi:hypothetical protein
MSHRSVADDLPTGWDDEPRLVVENRSNENPRLHLHFVTSPEQGQQPPRSTSMTFEGVVFYRWIDVDIGYEPDSPDDYAFTPIEIVDSELVADILHGGRWQNEGPERDLRRVFGADGLRHIRIGFDDHGTYDIVCRGLTVRPDSHG